MLIFEIGEEYEQSLLSSNKPIESVANTLALYFIFLTIISNINANEIGVALIENDRKKLKKARKKLLNKYEKNSEYNNDVKQFIKDSQKEIVDLMIQIKKSSKYSELAYYYNALRYYLEIVDNDNNDALNRII